MPQFYRRRPDRIPNNPDEEVLLAFYAAVATLDELAIRRYAGIIVERYEKAARDPAQKRDGTSNPMTNTTPLAAVVNRCREVLNTELPDTAGLSDEVLAVRTEAAFKSGNQLDILQCAVAVSARWEAHLARLYKNIPDE